VIPGRPFIAVLALLAALGALVGIFAWPAAAWYGAAALVAVVACVDAVLAARTPAPECERQLPHSMSLASWTTVGINIRNTEDRRTMRLRVFDHHPQSFVIEGQPRDATVRPRGFVDLAYRVRPTQRGEFGFAGIELRLESPLRLWWSRRLVERRDTVRVYPNYSTISKLLTFEVDNRLRSAGVRKSRRRGEGIEFHQLRDYREGDSLRRIDWKATSRQSRLIAREYQDERDQQVVFLLDTGRRMLAKDGELSHFDHALNAMLLLSFVALRQGDAVGIMTAGPHNAWLPPRKGADTINSILNHVYDVDPQPIEIDYVTAATELAVRQRRRSLIVVLSNVREEDSEDLLAATGLLRKRHLVMLASLRESALDTVLSRPVTSFDDALTYAATNEYLEARRESQRLLGARGVYVEDCLCEQLPSAITSRYLAIKRAGAL